MIIILTMLSEYERVFSNTRKLITFIYNCLKKNIIESYE